MPLPYADNDPLLRLNTICPYYTMYRLDFPYDALRRARVGQWVLDPFCGRGTTNFAARLHGLSSVGIDANPLAAAIAQAKLHKPRPAHLLYLCDEILTYGDEPQDVPSGEFWQLCYTPKVLYELCKFREHFLKHCNTPAAITLRAVILGLLHGPAQKTGGYLSNQMPRTYATKPNPAIKFWKKHRLKPRWRNIRHLLKHRIEFSLQKIPPKTDGLVLQADNRKVKVGDIPRKFDWVVTSPPYYSMRSYFPDNWLRNWFLGGHPNVTYESPAQLPHTSLDEFTTALAETWRNIARLCNPGAQMYIRFGALPSKSVDFAQVLFSSMRKAKAGWQVRERERAGTASRGKRQALQFASVGKALTEIDVRAVLEA